MIRDGVGLAFSASQAVVTIWGAYPGNRRECEDDDDGTDLDCFLGWQAAL